MPDNINILILGDIVGKIGRQSVKEILPTLIKKLNVDITVGNVENLAHGRGVTEKTLQEMMDAGMSAFTSGDHVWNKQDPNIPFESGVPIALPANDSRTKTKTPWTTVSVGDVKVHILSLIGRVYMPDDNLSNPFLAFDEMYRRMEKPSHLIVDIHTEATSEKVAQKVAQ